MIEKMKALAIARDICVLATVAGDAPHCSLMAYAVDENAGRFYMTTSRSTRKFANILKNPKVSLLIDSREKTPRSRAQALTVEGVCEPVPDGEEKEKLKAALLERHPHLKEILQGTDAEIIRVSVESFLFLDGLTDAYFEKMS